MSENKIEELTRSLYQEGVEKGEKRGEELVERARKRGAAIIDEAKKHADEIVEEARQRAATLRGQVETEINIAAREIIHDIRHKVTDMIVARAPGESIEAAFQDQELVAELIREVVQKWSPESEELSLSVILPDERKDELKSWFEKSLHDLLQKGLKLSFSPHIKGGFQVYPESSAYKIDFSREGFFELFQKYLKPRARRIIFGEEK